MSLMTLAAVIPIALLRLLRSLLLSAAKLQENTMTMKSAIANAEADTEIVPAATTLVPAPVDYPSWLDEFDHQVQALIQLAREGNRIAFTIVCDLQAKHSHASDQASSVAAILEQPARNRP